MKNFLKSLIPKKKSYLAECGHKTFVKDKISAFGETAETEIPIVDGKVKYCHKCLEKMTIRCAWCGRPIFIGDPITLYTPTIAKSETPDFAIVYSKDPLRLVGCGRSDCADTGADYCGIWYPPGEVRRIASAFEIAIANPGHAVIGNINDGFKLKKMG